MKKLITILICSLLFTATNSTLNATNPYGINDSVPYLEIKGKIAPKNRNNGTYKVELLFNNIVIDSKEVSDESSFSFILPSNRNYTVKIVKKGFATKHIGINTGLHKYEHLDKYYKYEFVTEMEEIVIKTTKIDRSEDILNMAGEFNKIGAANGNRKYMKKVKPLP